MSCYRTKWRKYFKKNRVVERLSGTKRSYLNKSIGNEKGRG